MNSTAESSFAPLEYYKKLTNCLASRKNLKLNVSRINGVKKNQKNVPVITTRNVQAKFLEKYSNKRVENINNDDPLSFPKKTTSNPLFNIKLNENNKRKKDDESFLYNLPETVFKSHDVPNLSIFKVPNGPQKKKQRVDVIQPEISTTNNFTIASLFSTNFVPPKCSTPFDVQESPKADELQAGPIISDPNEIFTSPKSVSETGAKDIEEVFTRKELVSYIALLDESAQFIDSAYFQSIPDMVDVILNRLNQKQLEVITISSQSNENDIADGTQCSSSNCLKSADDFKNKNTQSWPKPVFYDKPEDNVNDESISVDYQDSVCGGMSSLFETTKNIFSLLEEEDKGFVSVKDSSTSMLNKTSFLFESPGKRKPRDKHPPNPVEKPKPKKLSDIDWLEDAFTSMDMSWESSSDVSIASVKSPYLKKKQRSEISPIFRSPPKSSSFDIENFPRTIVKKSKSDTSWWSTDEDDRSRDFQLIEPKSHFGKRKIKNLWWPSNEDSFTLSDTSPRLFDSKISLF